VDNVDNSVDMSKSFIFQDSSMWITFPNLLKIVLNFEHELFNFEAFFVQLAQKVIFSPTPQGQEAPTSLSRGRNARFSSVFFSKMLLFAKIYGIIGLVKKMRCIYATDNYSKTSDFSQSF